MRVLQFALVFSTPLPVSVYGTGGYFDGAHLFLDLGATHFWLAPDIVVVNHLYRHPLQRLRFPRPNVHPHNR